VGAKQQASDDREPGGEALADVLEKAAVMPGADEIPKGAVEISLGSDAEEPGGGEIEIEDASVGVEVKAGERRCLVNELLPLRLLVGRVRKGGGRKERDLGNIPWRARKGRVVSFGNGLHGALPFQVTVPAAPFGICSS
jgi:hypothetical protein